MARLASMETSWSASFQEEMRRMQGKSLVLHPKGSTSIEQRAKRHCSALRSVLVVGCGSPSKRKSVTGAFPRMINSNHPHKKTSATSNDVSRLSTPRMPTLILRTRPGKRTSPIIWLSAIICAVVAVAVIVTGIVVTAVYVVYKPNMPYLRVPYAHLNKMDYNQSGLLNVEVAIEVEADNDNGKANASFSAVGFVLRFHGQVIAKLVAEPFTVAKNSSVALNYVVPSSDIPLGVEGMAEMNAALKRYRVWFDLDGQARTRWRVGVFLNVKFWTRLSCQLQFSAVNGSSIGLDCTSKSH